MAIVTVVIGFSSLFADLGVSASIIHKQDITHIQLSSLYWLNIMAGVVLFVMVYSLAPFIAHFYEESELVSIIRLLAVQFIITAIGTQYALLLEKALKFDVVAKINILSTLAGFLIAVVLAIRGFGVYALVYAALARTTAGTMMYLLTGLREHRPSPVFKFREITPMISFGLFQMGEKSANYFNSQFDVILIGKLLGAEALGLYSVAKNLAMKPARIVNPIVTKITFPVMAKSQNDLHLLKKIYLKTILYLSSINFPVYIALAILAEPVILLLFGEKWHDSIVILQILSLYGAIRSTGNPVGTLLLARGRADLGFYWNTGNLLLLPLVIFLGSFWGLTGVAYSLLFLVTFYVFPQWRFLVKPLCEASFAEYFWQILKPMLIAVTGGAFAFAFGSMLHLHDKGMSIAATGLMMGTVVAGLNVYFNRDFARALRELLMHRKIHKDR